MKWGHINLVALDKKAGWEKSEGKAYTFYPTAGNILTGEMGQATSIICDDCLENEKPIKFALKSTGDGYVYVPVDKLPTKTGNHT